eukprot:symbB.v1.2.041640.t1/scaffold8224.1/size7204/1
MLAVSSPFVRSVSLFSGKNALGSLEYGFHMLLRPTAKVLLEGPLFAEGGRASFCHSDEEWLSLVAPDLDGGCDKRSLRSQVTASTADLCGSAGSSHSDAFSSKGMSMSIGAITAHSMNDSTAMTMTDVTGFEETPAIANFDQVLQQAREERHEFSKDEFAQLLTTHQQSLLKQLNKGAHRQGFVSWH